MQWSGASARSAERQRAPVAGLPRCAARMPGRGSRPEARVHSLLARTLLDYVSIKRARGLTVGVAVGVPPARGARAVSRAPRAAAPRPSPPTPHGATGRGLAGADSRDGRARELSNPNRESALKKLALQFVPYLETPDPSLPIGASTYTPSCPDPPVALRIRMPRRPRSAHSRLRARRLRSYSAHSAPCIAPGASFRGSG